MTTTYTRYNFQFSAGGSNNESINFTYLLDTQGFPELNDTLALQIAEALKGVAWPPTVSVSVWLDKQDITYGDDKPANLTATPPAFPS